MRELKLLTAILIIFTAQAAVLDKSKHSSDDRRVHGKPLSDAPKVDGDYDYDHEAFLGDELNSELSNLSPEEAKRRLEIILEKIDINADEYVSEDELMEWIQHVQTTENMRESESIWNEKVPIGRDSITWEQYRNSTYGFLDDQESKYPIGLDLSGMVSRDERRFKMADMNNDGVLDREEFQDFIHPEESFHMKDIIVLETVEDMDKNKDGKIDINEFIADLWTGKEGEAEPDWVTAERNQFTGVRDKDHDGYLSSEEVMEWIIPEDFNLPLVEAHHLIVTVDTDNDGRLTREEILDRYEVFVGSQATQYGELLNRHDEF